MFLEDFPTIDEAIVRKVQQALGDITIYEAVDMIDTLPDQARIDFLLEIISKMIAKRQKELLRKLCACASKQGKQLLSTLRRATTMNSQ